MKDFLLRIWNYQPDPAVRYSVKARSLRLLGGFLALMVCCTIVSRTADAMTLATVQVGMPERAAIAHTVTADGVLEALDKVAVLAPENAIVKSIAVTEGQQVLTGDLLFTFDTDELTQQLTQKQLELQKVQLELRVLEENEAAKEAQRDLAVERAMEDLELLQDSTERSVAKATDEMNQARRELRDYDGDDEDEDAYKRALESLRASYRAAIRQHDQAVAEQEEAILKAERAIADAREPEDPSAQADLLRLDIRIKQLDIATIQNHLGTAGEVYAPADGVVETLSVKVGGRTGSGSAASITGSGDMRFVAKITEEEAKHVARGSSASLKLQGQDRSKDGFTVTSLRPVAGEAEAYELVLEVPAGTGEAGLSATITVTQRSQTYQTCVPLRALYQEMNQYYILVVRDRETALGLEQSVERINVEVEEKNERTAAVSGPLSSDTKVIVSTDKYLAEGDRVRVSAS